MPMCYFCRNHWIAIALQPKLGKILVLDSADFQSSTYAKFVCILNMLAKLLSFTFIFEYIVLDIMLNLPDTNNFLIIFSIK